MKRRTIEHYEILRKLGAGGSGVVYLANDTLLQRPVVLKILRAGELTPEKMRSTVLAKRGWPRPSSTPTFAAYTKWARAAMKASSPCNMCPANRSTS